MTEAKVVCKNGESRCLHGGERLRNGRATAFCLSTVASADRGIVK